MAECTCSQYKVYNTVYGDGKDVPSQVKYFTGAYREVFNQYLKKNSQGNIPYYNY